MKYVNAKKRKGVTAVSVVALAIVLALTGTFAWQSISQKALNENSASVNPGGRMHDDFNGTNKDIYAENFGEENLVVRVQLREYMEQTVETGTTKVVHGEAGAQKNDPSTWKIHKPTNDVTSCVGDIHKKVKWTMGGKTVFMPTFNMNQDSLKAEINGTLKENFEDYQTYEVGDTKTSSEIIDADKNTVEEEEPQEGVNITTISNKTHTAKETIDGTVITMAQWKEQGSKPGDYWVYDTDGWAYWANPLEPGKATGLLLNSVEFKEVMDDSWYYGIKAIGQFASMDDTGKKDNTGFYKDTGAKPSADAEQLLNVIGAGDVTYTVEVTPNTAEVQKGTTKDFSVQVTASDQSTPDQAVIWKLENAVSGTTKFEGTTLNVGADESAQTLILKAISPYGGGTIGKATITVVEAAQP